MQKTIHAIEHLADRIERTYRRRRPGWSSVGLSTQVWSVAATRLMEAHRADSTLPLDPELFVAAQDSDGVEDDPWKDLAGDRAVRRYRLRVRQMVCGLRDELKQELKWARGRMRRGDTIEAVLASRTSKLSPLGRYLIAERAHRADLSEALGDDARKQHRACPLYREACRGLIPPQSYPVHELIPGVELGGVGLSGTPSFSLN